MKTHPRRIVAACALGMAVLPAISTTAQGDPFQITSVGLSNNATVLQWESVAGWNFTLQRSTSLAPGSWSNVANDVNVPGVDGVLEACDTPQAASSVFYRVERHRPPYRHTIAIDGVNDFTADETFSKSSAGYTAFIAWDSTYVYLGIQGTDVGANSASKWVLIYTSGSPGTTTGVQYNMQQPQLPFGAGFHFRWRTDGNSSGLFFGGAAWASLSPGSEGNWHHSGSFLEWRIPLATIGIPSQFNLQVGLVNENSGSEWS